MTLSLTAIRKTEVGTVVSLHAAPFVRFKRGEDKQWHEVPRMGIAPRTHTSAELFELGVDTTE